MSSLTTVHLFAGDSLTEGIHGTVVGGTATPVPVVGGNANLDGMVDVLDLAILASNYGGDGRSWGHGDFDCDGTVGVHDLAILANHYGQPDPGGRPIPEPVTALLLVLGRLAAGRKARIRPRRRDVGKRL